MYHRYLEFPSQVRGGSVEPHWLADGNRFWYAEGHPEETAIWIVDPIAGTKRLLFDVDRLRRTLATTLGQVVPHLGLPFDGFTFENGEKAVRFDLGSELILDLDTYDVRRAPPLWEDELPPSERPGVPSPDGRWIATVRNYNLWLRSTEDGSEIQLTSDGVSDHEWQLGAAAWSPDGSTVAGMKIDSRQAPRIPLVDWLGPNEEVDWVRFPRRPGRPIARSELFFIDVRSGRRLRVDTGEGSDRRIFLLDWLPDGSHLPFLRMRDGDRTRVALVAADPVTGATRIVVTEEVRGVRFRTIGPYPGETPFTLLEDGRRFLWMSARTGWRHLYLYDIAGHLVRPLTRGEFPVERVVRVDETTGWVYFTARDDAERPYDTHLYRVSLQGEGLTRLTDAPGQHDIQFAPSGQFFLDTHSSVSRAPAVELRRADGELLRVLSAADVDALEELKWRPPEEFVVTTADGTTDLHGVLYKPFDFDPARKYPIIVHTGPAGRTFTDQEVVWAQAIAQLGFITFKVNVREQELSRRGGEFARVTGETIGHYEVPDYVAALEGLAADRPYMDLSRVGVLGLSYGGYHAIRAMLLAPDVFHVGVAVNAIADSYGHPNFSVLGPPADNRRAYEEASNLSLAGNLDGRLLLVHGTHDSSVPFSHAMKMVDALIREGKPYDLIIVPGWGHWISADEHVEQYLFDAYRRYFVEHLWPE